MTEVKICYCLDCSGFKTKFVQDELICVVTLKEHGCCYSWLLKWQSENLLIGFIVLVLKPKFM